MENANSHDYLHKIKSTVIDNIRRTGKPSVEAFTNIPPSAPGLNRNMDSEAEDEDDDLDADENRDVRMTQRQRDQAIEHDGELYDESDDEDYKNSLGVRPQPGVKKRRNITDYQNPNAAFADDIDALEMDETNGESAISTGQVSGAISRTNSPGGAADDDGDVDMDDPAAGAAETSRSQPAAAAASAMAQSSAPTADAAMEGVDDDTKEAIAEAKAEGQSERDTENVRGEVRTEVAKE
jgi:histone deacetylase 1/2